MLKNRVPLSPAMDKLTEYTFKQSNTRAQKNFAFESNNTFPQKNFADYFFVESKGAQGKRRLHSAIHSRFVLCASLFLVSIIFSNPALAKSSISVDVNALAQKIIQAESSGNPKAVGDNGKSRGLMQIQEATWKRHTTEPYSKAFDPELNVKVGKMELQRIIKAYRAKGIEPSEAYVTWAYNTGSLIKKSLPKFDKQGRFHKWTWLHPNAVYRQIYREYLG